MNYMLYIQGDQISVGRTDPNSSITIGGQGIEITEEQYNDIRDNHLADFYDHYEIVGGKVQAK